jgi:hypothetical protein
LNTDGVPTARLTTRRRPGSKSEEQRTRKLRVDEPSAREHGLPNAPASRARKWVRFGISVLLGFSVTYFVLAII